MPKGISKIALVIIFAVIAIIVAFSIYSATTEEMPEFDFVEIDYQDLLQMVSVTGHVKPVESVELSFEVTGKIDMVLKEVGDMVVVGEPIVKLVNFELSLQLSQAKSELMAEQARLKQLEAVLAYENAILNEINRGARDEDIRISQTNLDNARIAQADAKNDLSNVILKADQDLANLYNDAEKLINDAYVAVDDVINIKTDSMFSDRIYDAGDLVFIVSDNLLNSRVRALREDSSNVMESFAVLLENFPADYSQIDSELSDANQELLIVRDFLFSLTEALSISITLNSTDKSTYQINVDAARDTISLAKNNIVDLIQEIFSQKVANQKNIDASQSLLNNSQNAIALAEDQLAFKLVDALPEKVASQQARIAQAEANIEAQLAVISAVDSKLDIIRNNIEKTVMRSPINGIVTVQNAKTGQLSTLAAGGFSDPLVAIMSMNQFQIETNIPEVDIANIKIGDLSDLTLDAYTSDEIFEAVVVKINPAERIIEGVSTYKVTLEFSEEDKRIKSGMTANLDIITAEKDNVLTVPQRSVITKNGQKSVKLLIDDEFVEVMVKTGLVSWDGQVEILEGVNSGDKVITYIEE